MRIIGENTITLSLPESTQTVFGEVQASQPQILARAAAVASRLTTIHGVQPGDRVGLFASAGSDVVPSILGVWMAGAAYVPLDPHLPDDMLLRILRDADLSCVLTQEEHFLSLDLLEYSLGHPVRYMLMASPEIESEYRSNIGKKINPKVVENASPSRPAYLIYTSGSTGEAKGVVCTFGGLSNLVAACKVSMSLDDSTRYLQFASINFDASVLEMFPTLFCGGTVVHGTRDEMMPGRGLFNFIIRNNVTHLCLAPSVLGQIPDPDKAKCVTCVTMGGERCPRALAAKWQDPSIGRKVFNAYGPTEATVCSTAYLIDPADKSDDPNVPIGDALPNVLLRIVADDGKECPVGVAGELWVGGVSVAEGYRNKPDLTAAKFIVDDKSVKWYRTGDEVIQRADGGIIFVGRIDQQVKIRGYRVELSAIEHVLFSVPGVAQAAVKLCEKESADGTLLTMLVAYYSVGTDATEALSADTLREAVAASLPEYMVPQTFMEMDSIPLMPNLSKIDRNALPLPTTWGGPTPPTQAKSPKGRPVSAAKPKAVQGLRLKTLTRRLSGSFEQTLGLTEGCLGDSSNFFQAGGDSLSVARLVSAIENEFSVSIAPSLVYSCPTPAELAPYFEPDSPLRHTNHDVIKTMVNDTTGFTVSGGRAGGRGIFLTGATGFLGIHLLARLLPGTSFVVCLVRAENENEGRRRIIFTAEKYGVPLSTTDSTRLRVVVGDTVKVHMGMSDEEFDMVCSNCDTVVHAAANIGYLLPYTESRKSIVDGTAEILKVCTTGITKHLHYVSTLGVLGAVGTLNNTKVVTEDEPLDGTIDAMKYANGYTQAKWVAERIVTKARDESKLPVSIHRCGFITGDSNTGIGNADDMFNRFMSGISQMGMAPNFPKAFWLPTPVDYMARGMAHIIAVQPPGGMYCFAPERDFEPSYTQLAEAVSRVRGIKIQVVPAHEWLRELGGLKSDNDLFPLKAYLRQKVYGSRTGMELSHLTPVIDTTRTRSILSPVGIFCPQFTDSLLKKYLDFLTKAGGRQ